MIRQRIIEYIAMALLLSPLLFINIRSSHDWGDDFAGYLTEAQHIAHGEAFYQSRVVPQDYMPSYAPQYYSYGFPLMLSPVVKAFGLDFRALNIYMSLWVVAWALLVFYYLRRRFSFFTAAVFVCIVFVNPWFFEFKAQVISDVPFAFFFTLGMLCFLRRGELSLTGNILWGIVMGFTIGIRDLGYLLPAFLVADLVWADVLSMMQTGARPGVLRRGGLALGVAGAFVLVMRLVVFRDPGSQLSHFVSLYQSPDYWQTILANLDVYTRLYQGLFSHEVGRYTFMLYYSTAFMLVLAVLGFVRLLYGAGRWEWLILVAYTLVVLLFPFSSQGFRYMLPVLPLLMVCAALGAKSIQLPVNRYAAGIAFFLFMMLVNVRDIKHLHGAQASVVAPGPMTADSRALLEYIGTLPDTAIIATVKPRAVALLTGHRTCLLPKNATPAFISGALRRVAPQYVLHIDGVMTDIADDYAAYEHDSLIWQQGGHRLYLSGR
ncbi:MAG: phospholipid carrier-dependent glycosyltransferase [Bacteroidetes bacterium]|nr:phospholipid carrier-dependent glycosyltransferase [Bacteroidota bacterium]